AYSLRPVAARMAELLGADVALAADVTGDDARAQAAALQDGQVLLLENVRFDARETSKDDAERAALAGEMAALAGEDGAYVGDAFGAVHRKHASVFDVAAQLPAYQGPLVAAELEVLTRLTESPEQPY
ncbi:phosphoglycerate kinase, partial [Micrococcus luteus]|nr:phosphoglycerate kinase [Micrococcus luteus]